MKSRKIAHVGPLTIRGTPYRVPAPHLESADPAPRELLMVLRLLPSLSSTTAHAACASILTRFPLVEVRKSLSRRAPRSLRPNGLVLSSFRLPLGSKIEKEYAGVIPSKPRLCSQECSTTLFWAGEPSQWVCTAHSVVLDTFGSRVKPGSPGKSALFIRSLAAYSLVGLL